MTRLAVARSSPQREVEALAERSGQFVKVRVAGADEGWVESDQIVPSPAVSTRAAQIETARFT